MNPDHALALLRGLAQTVLAAAGPVLLTSLVAGVAVGILQTATQINEASVSFVVKLIAVALVTVLVGPMIAAHVVTYTKQSFAAVAEVVR